MCINNIGFGGPNKRPSLIRMCSPLLGEKRGGGSFEKCPVSLDTRLTYIRALFSIFINTNLKINLQNL